MDDQGTAIKALEQYRTISEEIARSDRPMAKKRLEEFFAQTNDLKVQALLHNDLGVLAAMDGDLEQAGSRFRQALQLDPECDAARGNLLETQPAPNADGVSGTGEGVARSARSMPNESISSSSI